MGRRRRPAVPAADPGRAHHPGGRAVAHRLCDPRRASLEGRSFAPALARWRDAWLVPRRVYLAVADNRLLLDLEAPSRRPSCATSCAGWPRRRAVAPGAVARARACLARRTAGPPHDRARRPDRAARARPRGRDEAQAAPHVAVPSAGERLRAPGSDWLFLKLYGPRDDEEDAARLRGPAVRPVRHRQRARGALVLHALRRPRAARAGALRRRARAARAGAFPRCASGPRSCSPPVRAGASLRHVRARDRALRRPGRDGRRGDAVRRRQRRGGRLRGWPRPSSGRSTAPARAPQRRRPARRARARARAARWYRERVAAKHRSGDDYRKRRTPCAGCWASRPSAARPGRRWNASSPRAAPPWAPSRAAGRARARTAGSSARSTSARATCTCIAIACSAAGRPRSNTCSGCCCGRARVFDALP